MWRGMSRLTDIEIGFQLGAQHVETGTPAEPLAGVDVESSAKAGLPVCFGCEIAIPAMLGAGAVRHSPS